MTWDCCSDREVCGTVDCKCSNCNYDGCCCAWRVLNGEITSDCLSCRLLCRDVICGDVSNTAGCYCTESFNVCYNICIETGDPEACRASCLDACVGTAKWNCVSGTCIQDARSTTGWSSKEECELNEVACQQKKYKCINGKCVFCGEVGTCSDPAWGQYTTLEACKAANCGLWQCNSTDLQNRFCEFIKDTTSGSQTQVECNAVCGPIDKYSCKSIPGKLSVFGCIFDEVNGVPLAQCQASCGSYRCNQATKTCDFISGDLTGYSDPETCRINCQTAYCCTESCGGSCQELTLSQCAGKPMYDTLNNCNVNDVCCGTSKHYECVNKPGTSGSGEPGTKQCVQKTGPYIGAPNTYQTLTECNSKCGTSWYCRTCKPCVKDIGLIGSNTQTICESSCPDKGYRCDMGVCVQDVCGGGLTITECENQCFRWRCDVSTPQTTSTPCTKYKNTSNGYLNQQDCLDNTFCNTTPRYKCVTTTCPNNPSKPLTKTCIETYEEGAGTFGSILECQNSGCGNPDTSVTYNCNSNKCIAVNYCDDAYPGRFTELKGPTGCEESCWGWGCNMNTCSQLEGIPESHETCADTCHCKWKKTRLLNGCYTCEKLCGRVLGSANPLCDEWGANCRPSPIYFDNESDCRTSIYNNNEGTFACIKGGGCQRIEDVLDPTQICSTYCNRTLCTNGCKVKYGYNCVSGTCSPNNGCTVPEYATLSDCQKICEYRPPVGYNCELKKNTFGGIITESYQCVPTAITDEGAPPSTQTPQFPTLGLCKTFCLNTGVLGWYCSGNDCVLAKSTAEIDGKITFATYQDCAVSCIIPNQSPCGNTPVTERTNIQNAFNLTTKLNNNG